MRGGCGLRIFNARILLAVVGITAGAALLLAGLAAFGVYVQTLFDVMDQADRSPIFWYLVFVEAGVVLTVIGGFFVVLGVWTYRDPQVHLAFLGGSLLALLMVGIVAGVYVAVERGETERARKQRTQARAVRRELARTMHRLERLEVVRLGDDGFTAELTASGERTGTYRWTLIVASGGTEFLRETDMLKLEAGDTTFRHRVAYRDLFRTCNVLADFSRVPVCVDGTGARTFWTVEARLRLRNEVLPPGPVSVGPGWDRSSKRTQLVLDTFTQDGTVDVREARRPPEVR